MLLDYILLDWDQSAAAATPDDMDLLWRSSPK